MWLLYNYPIIGLMILLFLATSMTVSSQSIGTAIPLSDDNIWEIVNAHNFLRGSVEPQASNMRSVIWDEGLAAAAQDFSMRCELVSNPDRAAQVPGFATVGENWTAVGTSGLPNYTNVLTVAWFNQRNLYNFEENSCTTQGACSFYTQMVWADTTAVGCGAARCADIPVIPTPTSVVFFCYYGPQGNAPGMRPYLEGTPCSACPQDQNVCIDRLCTNGNDIFTPDQSTIFTMLTNPTTPTTETTPTTQTLPTTQTTPTVFTTKATPSTITTETTPTVFVITTEDGDDDEDSDEDSMTSQRRSQSSRRRSRGSSSSSRSTSSRSSSSQSRSSSSRSSSSQSGSSRSRSSRRSRETFTRLTDTSRSTKSESSSRSKSSLSFESKRSKDSKQRWHFTWRSGSSSRRHRTRSS